MKSSACECMCVCVWLGSSTNVLQIILLFLNIVWGPQYKFLSCWTVLGRKHWVSALFQRWLLTATLALIQSRAYELIGPDSTRNCFQEEILLLCLKHWMNIRLLHWNVSLCCLGASLCVTISMVLKGWNEISVLPLIGKHAHGSHNCRTCKDTAHTPHATVFFSPTANTRRPAGRSTGSHQPAIPELLEAQTTCGCVLLAARVT